MYNSYEKTSEKHFLNHIYWTFFMARDGASLSVIMSLSSWYAQIEINEDIS